ncbi:hypothetical protein FQR65_LT17888 [Abscondita terminalis]|nr:hypothetical protein FQR65_LT17888 [Abscondita terminalis]
MNIRIDYCGCGCGCRCPKLCGSSAFADADANIRNTTGPYMLYMKCINNADIIFNIDHYRRNGRASYRISIVGGVSRIARGCNDQRRHVGQFRSYTGNSPADLHGMWYPTVKRTLVCLSRLYCCLDREIFQGLAQEALAICVETIAKAEDQISVRKTPMDGRLFQIKHLLILREQIAPFQVDFTVKEVSLDFSNIKAAAVGLINNRNKLFTFSSNNALLEFLLEGTPKVREYLIDSRKEIDKQLKSSCEALISNTTTLIIGPVLQWIRKAESFLQNEDSGPLYKEEFAKPGALGIIMTNARKSVKSRIPEVQRCMKLYLANRETEFILFRPIKINIMNAFVQVESILETAKYSHEDQIIVACPTPEQVNVLICSVSLSTEQDGHSDVSSTTVKS